VGLPTNSTAFRFISSLTSTKLSYKNINVKNSYLNTRTVVRLKCNGKYYEN